jgi:S-DNA-T family DNA segregation ATPase FtsK/SpoIIIE
VSIAPLMNGGTRRHSEAVAAEEFPAFRDVEATTPHLKRRSEGLLLSRPPRLGWRYVPHPLALPKAPSLPSPPQSWQSIALTAVAGVLVTVVVAVAYGSNPVFLLVSAASLLTTVIAVVQQFVARAQTNRQRRQLTTDYRSALEKFERTLEQAVRDELDARRQAEPPLQMLLDRCNAWSERLWERRPHHDDFLNVRLGSADIPSGIPIQARQTTAEDGLAGEGEQVVERHHLLTDAPFVVDVWGGSHALGIAGSADAVVGVARALLIGLASTHGPDDVRIAILAGGGANDDTQWSQAPEWRWTKWLPHLADDHSASANALLACDSQRRGELLFDLAAEVERRSQAVGGAIGSGSPMLPAYVVVVGDPGILLDSPAGQQILERGPDFGFRFVILGRVPAGLPNRCDAVLAFDSSTDAQALAPTATFSAGDDARPTVRVVTQALGGLEAERAARALAPLRPYESLHVGAVPSSAQLADVLGLRTLLPGDALNWWLAGERDATIRATLGVTSGTDGLPQPLELDMERDGPHGLIAGTTGSGKSELLLTLILSLAWKYHPNRLGFLLIDYKGGAAFGPTVNLPHTLGLVTDLDEQLAQRCLVGLKAELKRRERLLREHQVANVAAYQHLTDVPPLPHMLVIIDELAQLLKEVPSFVDGLVSVAQVGRSLGVHLILATQKPEGVVAGPIQANTNFRICLRVADPSESTSVLASPDAANIPLTLPGRGFMRVAQEKPREFQTARVAGHALAGRVALYARVLAPEGATAGIPSHLLDANAHTRVQELAPTDLERLVEHVRQAAEAEHLRRLPSPWLEPLPAVLEIYEPRRVGAAIANGSLDQEEVRAGAPPTLFPNLPRGAIPPPYGWLAAPIGLQDRPVEQWQGPLIIDLLSIGHMLALGAFGAGTDTALAALGTALALTHTPDDLHLYALDFGMHALRPLATFPHCGEVIGPTDRTRCRRLFRVLGETLVERRKLLGKTGAGNWTEYRARVRQTSPAPYIVVLIDNFAAFAELHEPLIEQLPSLLRDGRTIGLHVAVGADQVRSLPIRLAPLFEGVLVLRQTDPAEMQSLTGLRRNEIPTSLPPGSGFWRLSEAVTVQIAQPVIATLTESGAERLAGVGRELAGRWMGAVAPPIAILPDRLSLSTLERALNGTLSTRGQTLAAPFALDDDSLAPTWIDIETSPVVLVAGPPDSGRSTTLVTCVRSLVKQRSPEDVHVYLFAAGETPLDALSDLPHVVRLPNRATAVARATDAGELLGLLRDRLARERTSISHTAQSRHLVVLDDYDLLSGRLDGGQMQALEELLEGARGAGLTFLVAGRLAAFENSSDTLVRAGRYAKHAILLSPRDRSQVDNFGASIPRGLEVEWVPGRALYIVEGQFRIVQVAQPDVSPLLTGS